MRFTAEEQIVAPIRAVRCPYCARWLPVDALLTALDALWMHEYECAGIVLVPAA